MKLCPRWALKSVEDAANRISPPPEAKQKVGRVAPTSSSLPDNAINSSAAREIIAEFGVPGNDVLRLPQPRKPISMLELITIQSLMPKIRGRKLVPVLIEPPDLMFSVSPPLPVFTACCGGCVHLQGQGFCAAFPQGIPLEIALGIANHRELFEGDNGIRFESNGEHVMLPLHEEMTQNLLTHIQNNLNTIEVGKSSMPIDIPAILGQLNRGDTMDKKAEEAELDRLNLTAFAHLRYLQRLKGLNEAEIVAENQEFKRILPKAFERMMKEEQDSHV